MREDLIQHFSARIMSATSKRIPDTENEDGSFVARNLLSDDASYRLAQVIAEMIEAALDEWATR